MKFISFFLKYLTFLLGVVLIVVSERGTSALHLKKQSDELSSLLLKDKSALPNFTLGFHSFLSSLLWTGCILDYADQVVLGEKNDGIVTGLYSVIQLDSLWKYPHEFAGLILENADGSPTPDALKILSIGLRRFPEDSRLVIIYAQSLINSKQIDSITRYDSARKVLTKLMDSKVRAPEYARTLAISLAAKVYGDKDALRQMLHIWGAINDPLIEYSFAKKLPRILSNTYGFKGDSLAIASGGIDVLVRSKSPEVLRQLDIVILALGERGSRQKAFRFLGDVYSESESRLVK